MPRLHLRSEPYLSDEWIPFRVTELAPGQHFALHLEHIDDVGQAWVSCAEFCADANGIVDTADAPSRNGSYTGISRDGLLWSMAPAGISDRVAFMKQGKSFMHMVGQPGGDRLQPRQHMLRVKQEGRVLAEACLSQTRLGPGVRVQ